MPGRRKRGPEAMSHHSFAILGMQMAMFFIYHDSAIIPVRIRKIAFPSELFLSFFVSIEFNYWT